MSATDYDEELPLLCEETGEATTEETSAMNTTEHSQDKEGLSPVNRTNDGTHARSVSPYHTNTVLQRQTSAEREQSPRTMGERTLYFEERHFENDESTRRGRGNTDQHRQRSQGLIRETLEPISDNHEVGKLLIPYLGTLPVTIVSLLKKWARTRPRQNAFVFLAEQGAGRVPRATAVTREQLYGLAVLYAVYLRSAYNIRPQDIVCNTLPNCLERVVVDLGIIMASAVLLDAPRNVDTDEKMKQFCDYLSYLDVRLVVSAKADPFSRLIVRKAEQIGCQVCYSFISDTSTDGQSFRAILQAAIPSSIDQSKAESLLPGAAEEDMAVLWPTRGRSGGPRVIAHSHKSVLQIGCQFNHHLLGLEDKDVYFTSAGLGSLYGFPSIFLLTGVTTLVEDKTQATHHLDVGQLEACKPRPLLPWDTLIDQGCTAAFFTTHDMEKYQDGDQIRKGCLKRKLKRVVLAGDQVKTVLVKALCAAVTEEVTVAYCMAEIGLVACSQRNQNPYKEGDKLKLLDDVGATSTRLPLFEDCPETYFHGTLSVKKPYIFAESGTDMKGQGNGGVFRKSERTETYDLGAVYSSRSVMVLGRADKQPVDKDVPTVIRTEMEFQMRTSTFFISDASVVALQAPHRPGFLRLFGCLVVEPSLYCERHLLGVYGQCNAFWEKLDDYIFRGYYIFREFPKTLSGFPDRNALKDLIAMKEQGLYKIRPRAILPGDDWFFA